MQIIDELTNGLFSFIFKKINIQSVRTQFYEYIKCAPHLRTEDGYGYALDISFGTAGFTLALARAFEKVCSCNMSDCT